MITWSWPRVGAWTLPPGEVLMTRPRYRRLTPILRLPRISVQVWHLMSPLTGTKEGATAAGGRSQFDVVRVGGRGVDRCP